MNPVRLRGVNLGGWLVLEKWMTPSLFRGMDATDETSWCVESGSDAAVRLNAHWDSFITKDDFKWIKERGLNAVRIPVGHWLLGQDYPYHSAYGTSRTPFVTGGAEYLDRAMKWAEEYGLKVVIDLHAAPGCQNGFDNGGIKDFCDWHKKDVYRSFSLDFLELLASRYSVYPALAGIEVLNEPRWTIPTGYLKEYTQDAYWRIRKYCSKNYVSVIFHDGFRPAAKYRKFMREPEYSNVMLDIHRYQCFNQGDLAMSIYDHLNKVAVGWANEAERMWTNPGLWSMVGEWSLGLNLKEVSLWAPGPYDCCVDGMDKLQRDAAYRAYGSAQLITFERHNGGWFFWSYKTETTPAWSFRDCVSNGWLPNNFDS